MLVVPQFESILKIRIMGKMKAVKTAVRLPLSTQVLSFPFVPLCESGVCATPCTRISSQ
jgi:hypothetical protein